MVSEEVNGVDHAESLQQEWSGRFLGMPGVMTYQVKKHPVPILNHSKDEVKNC
jgi:hypothetical protein